MSLHVLVICGSEDFLRRRFLREFLATQEKDGYTLHSLDGKVKGSVQDALDTVGMFGGKHMLVVHSPDKGDVTLYENHLQNSREGDPVLVLHYEGDPKGNTKFGKFAEAQKRCVKQFSVPSPFEVAKVAARFLITEARRYGKKVSVEMADEIVVRAGTDLGVLAYEVQKMALLADADGVEDFDPIRVRGAMAELSEAALGPLVDALGSKDVRAVARALTRIGRTSKDDPTIRTVRLLGSAVRTWFQAACLQEQDPDLAAAELGMKPYRFKVYVRPLAMRWGKAGTRNLINILAVSERGVLDGHLDPWTAFSARLLEACSQR